MARREGAQSGQDRRRLQPMGVVRVDEGQPHGAVAQVIRHIKDIFGGIDLSV